MSVDPNDIITAVQAHYGTAKYKDHLFDDDGAPHRYVMAVRTNSGGKDHTYYEASDDFDELCEQASLILIDNVTEWPEAIAAPLVIVDTTTGRFMEPNIQMLQFTEMSGTVQDWLTE